MTAAGMTTQYVLDNGLVLEAISGGHTTVYLYGVGVLGQLVDQSVDRRVLCFGHWPVAVRLWTYAPTF